MEQHKENNLLIKKDQLLAKVYMACFRAKNRLKLAYDQYCDRPSVYVRSGVLFIKSSTSNNAISIADIKSITISGNILQIKPRSEETLSEVYFENIALAEIAFKRVNKELMPMSYKLRKSLLFAATGLLVYMIVTIAFSLSFGEPKAQIKLESPALELPKPELNKELTSEQVNNTPMSVMPERPFE